MNLTLLHIFPTSNWSKILRKLPQFYWFISWADMNTVSMCAILDLMFKLGSPYIPLPRKWKLQTHSSLFWDERSLLWDHWPVGTRPMPTGIFTRWCTHRSTPSKSLVYVSQCIISHCLTWRDVSDSDTPVERLTSVYFYLKLLLEAGWNLTLCNVVSFRGWFSLTLSLQLFLKWTFMNNTFVFTSYHITSSHYSRRTTSRCYR